MLPQKPQKIRTSLGQTFSKGRYPKISGKIMLSYWVRGGGELAGRLGRARRKMQKSGSKGKGADRFWGTVVGKRGKKDESGKPGEEKGSNQRSKEIK